MGLFVVDILLATYNGRQYLEEQIDSILSQSFKGWRIIARDDQSSDGTGSILESYRNRYPEKFQIVRDKLGNVGIRQNFSILMQNSTSPYIMFCDQDDVWLPDKLQLSVDAIKTNESLYPVTPLLLHSDLKVTDQNLNVDDTSFWHFQNLDPFLDSLNRLLVQNTVTGCTVMFNRLLLIRALPIPPHVVMHDWWLALVAAAFGKIIVLREPTVLYRQHGKNDTGAKQWSLSYIIDKAFVFWDRSNLLMTLSHTQRQASLFKDRYENDLSNEQNTMIDSFVKLNNNNFLEKRVLLVKYRLLKQGLIRNLALFLRL